MKTKLLTISLTVCLLAVLGGAFLLSTLGVEPVGAAIKFDPNVIDWDTFAPDYWYATIRCGDGYDWNPRDIDDTRPILFQDTVEAIGGKYISGGYVAKFNGQAVFDVLSGMIGHMQVKKARYDFKVSGYLKDGTPFEGYGWIKVTFSTTLPPPPPPP